MTLLSVVPYFADLRNGKHLDFFGESIGRLSRIDHPQPLQFKVFNSCLHGTGQSGGVFILEFHAPVSALRLPEKVQLRAGVGVPKIEVPRYCQKERA